MAEDQSPPLPPRNPVIHNAAIVGTIIIPIAMLLPPRKMDIRFFVLAGAFSLSTNQLAYAYTGQSLYSRFGQRTGSMFTFETGLPEGAKRTQQLLRERKEREAALQSASNNDHKNSLVKDIWMGGESEDWKQKRAEEHQKSFEEGKGMSGIIMEQISDVWSGDWKGKPKKTEDAEAKREPENK